MFACVHAPFLETTFVSSQDVEISGRIGVVHVAHRPCLKDDGLISTDQLEASAWIIDVLHYFVACYGPTLHATRVEHKNGIVETN